MKKMILVFSLLCVLIIGTLSFTSCTKRKEPKETAEMQKIKVATSFVVLADIVRNVAGDAADVVSITKIGAEIHEYEPTPQDIVNAQDADIIIYNGLNLELWFERFLQDIEGDIPVVVVSEGIEPISIYEGPYEGKPNPHAWMSLTDGQKYVENIRAALVDIDPDNADVYNKNAKEYSDKIAGMHDDLKKVLDTIPQDKRYLVTSEGAFSYLARDFNLQEVFLWAINAEQQGTPQQVRRVIDIVNSENIPVVFSESTISPKPAQQVAAETEAIYGGVLYVDSLTNEDGAVPTYLDLLTVTTQTIANGFSKALSQ